MFSFIILLVFFSYRQNAAAGYVSTSGGSLPQIRCGRTAVREAGIDICRKQCCPTTIRGNIGI